MKNVLILALACTLLVGNHAILSASDRLLTVDIHINGIRRIAIVDPDEGCSDPIFLTDPTSNNFGGVWSPDGKQIAFSSDRDGNCEIYTMDANGENPRRVTNKPSVDSSPSWSPDGKKLAFTRAGGPKPCVYTIDVNGQNEALLAEDAAYADWSPDGESIVLIAKRDLQPGVYVIDIDSGEWEPLIVLGASLPPKWSPDGKQITLTINTPIRKQLYIMDVETKDFAQRTDVPQPRSACGSCWSPDGKEIAYSVQAPGETPHWRTWIMNASGSKQRRLDCEHSIEPTSWVPISVDIFTEQRAVHPAGKLVATWGSLKKGNPTR